MSAEGAPEGYVIQGFNPAMLFGKGFHVGCADLIQGGSFRVAVGRCIITLLMCAVDKDGRRPFKRVTIVLPPVTVTSHTEESVFTSLKRAVMELRGFELDEQEEHSLRRVVNIVNSPSLEVDDLLCTVKKQGKQSLIAVADANMYRDHLLNLTMTFGISAVRLSEDQWAPHVASICRQLVPIAKELEGYGVIHVTDVPARKLVNTTLLLSVDDCYVTCLEYEDDSVGEFNSRVPAWRTMVLKGQLQDVMSEIEVLAVPEGVRLHALVQLLRGTGHDSEMLKLIAQLQPHLATVKVEASIQVAQLAVDAGDDELAREVLPKGPEGLGDQVWLEEGLELATYIEDNERITRFDTRLNQVFPRSARLRENRDRRLLMNLRRGRFSESHLFTQAGFTDYHLHLQQILFSEKPDYAKAIEESRAWGQDWFELTGVCCAMHAQSASKPWEAAVAASFITCSNLYGRQATQVLLSSLKLMMLKELVPEGEHDVYRLLFRTVFQFLALHPEDNSVRLRLTTLLSVESCGDMGIPIVALTMLDLVQQGTRMARPSVIGREDRSVEPDGAILSSIERALQWLGELGLSEPGVTEIPLELLGANPDDVVCVIARLVHRSSGREGENVDLTFMTQLVFLACAICPHATEEHDEDIRLMRHLASQCAIAGQFQQARNFAEQILLMGQTSAYRRRLAWQAFGDIYQRCRNPMVALVSLACALAVDVEVDKADLWQEAYAIHRVLRDLGLFELSRSFLPAMKTLLSDLGYDAEKDPRYVTARLSLQLMEIGDAETESIGEIIGEVTGACQRELGGRNNLLPLTFLLGQCVLKAEGAGLNVSQEVRAILDTALKQVGASMADMVRTISVVNPTAKDVLTIFNSVERAAYVLDVATDYRFIEVAARRLLDSNPQGERNLSEKVFAIELLGDHSVALVGDAPVMTEDWPTQYAVELNQAGVDVAFLAIDSQGELTVIHVANGQVRTVEQPKSAQSFRHRFHVWLEDHPKDYGYSDPSDGNNIFYQTMERLDVRLPLSEKLIIVAEPFLQPLTTNLVVMPPEDGGFNYFAGTKVAIGIVPSLSWLSAARNAKRSSLTTYKAWISADTSSAFRDASAVMSAGDGYSKEELEREPTLDIVLRRLSSCFEDFGFMVDTGRRLPVNMKDAGLAVVTAHGGLSRTGSYLHSIRDDADLVVAPSALAAAVAGVEVVILFVCSGGRIDKNPWDNSTTSLSKLLLNKGSRAVIASPWPLNVMVTYNWLEPFLREWEAGATVLDATMKANAAVAQHLGDFPPYSLAMRVYGDVLFTRPEIRSNDHF